MGTVTKSIGSGKDYSTVTAWEAAAYGATGSDDAVGEVYGTIVESAGVSLTDTTPLSMTLQSASSDRHTGIIGTGALIQITGGTYPLTFNESIDRTIQWLEIDLGTINSNYGIYVNGGSSPYRGIVQNNLIYGFTSSKFAGASGFYINTGTSLTDLFNNLFYDCGNDSGDFEVLDLVDGFTGNIQIINNTITACFSSSGDCWGIYCIDDANYFVESNLISNLSASGTSYCCYFAGSSNVTTAANGTDDSTSPDSGYSSLTVNFNNPSGGDFTPLGTCSANVLSGGVDQGTTANVDLKGRDRDAQGDSWSLGGIQYVAGGTTIYFNANANGALTTSASILAIARALSAAANGTLTTSTPALDILVLMSAAADGALTTSTPALSVLRELTAAANGTLSTSSPIIAILRELSASANGILSTSNPALDIVVLFSAAATGLLTTSTPALDITCNFSAAAAGILSISNPELAIFRELTAAATGTLSTSAPILAILRALTAAATGTLTTSDINLLIDVFGIGIIANPSTISATPKRVTTSATPQRRTISTE